MPTSGIYRRDLGAPPVFGFGLSWRKRDTVHTYRKESSTLSFHHVYLCLSGSWLKLMVNVGFSCVFQLVFVTFRLKYCYHVFLPFLFCIFHCPFRDCSVQLTALTAGPSGLLPCAGLRRRPPAAFSDGEGTLQKWCKENDGNQWNGWGPSALHLPPCHLSLDLDFNGLPKPFVAQPTVDREKHHRLTRLPAKTSPRQPKNVLALYATVTRNTQI